MKQIDKITKPTRSRTLVLIESALKELQGVKVKIAEVQQELHRIQDDLGQEAMVEWHQEREKPEADKNTDDIPF